MNTDLQVLDSLASLRLYLCPFGPSAKSQLECAYVGQGSRTDNIFFFSRHKYFAGFPAFSVIVQTQKGAFAKKKRCPKHSFAYLNSTYTDPLLFATLDFIPSPSNGISTRWVLLLHSQAQLKLFDGTHSSFGALKSGSTTVLFFFCLLLDKLRTLYFFFPPAINCEHEVENKNKQHQQQKQALVQIRPTHTKA